MSVIIEHARGEGRRVSAGSGSGALPDLVVGRLYAAVVSDILDDLGRRDHTLDPAIRPLGRGAVIAGPANPFLVTEVHQIPAEPYTGEIGALDDITGSASCEPAVGHLGGVRLVSVGADSVRES